MCDPEPERSHLPGQAAAPTPVELNESCQGSAAVTLKTVTELTLCLCSRAVFELSPFSMTLNTLEAVCGSDQLGFLQKLALSFEPSPKISK